MHLIKNQKKNPNETNDIALNIDENNLNLLFLHMFKYINLSNKGVTLLGSALRFVEPEFEEYIFIVLYMLQCNHISQIFGNPFNDSLRIR